MLTSISTRILTTMDLSMRHLALKRLSKTVWLSERTFHILEIARALLHGKHVPTRYWPDAVSIAVYLLNRFPSKVLQFQTPL